MAFPKGGGTLQAQIQKLEHELQPKEIEQAKKMATQNPTMVRLAFKYLDKPHRKEGLSKSQMATFEQIRKIDAVSADKWKAARQAEKSAK